MVQKQLVDYIKSQQALGANREAIKNALVGAGWPAADVNDSMMTVGPSPASVSSSPSSTPSASISIGNLSAGGDAKTFAGGSLTKSDFTDVPHNMMPAHPSHPAHHLHIGYVILTVIAVALAGVAVLFYFRYNALRGQASSLSGQLAAVNSQNSTLQSQVNDLTQSGNALKTQVGNLTQVNSELSNELYFFITPAAATSSVTATLTGTLSSSTKGYTLLTADGLKVTVLNYADAGVASALEPLIGSTVQVSGTHAPNSKAITVSSVNGNAIPQTAPSGQ